MSFNVNSDKEFVRGSRPKLIGDNELTIRNGTGSLEREVLRAELDANTGLPRVGINRTGQRINNIEVTNGGAGYTQPPSVQVGPPNDPAGIQCQASAFIFNGSVVNVAINIPGSGYTSVPTVVINSVDGNGFGATGEAFRDTVDYELDINGAIRTSTSIISDTANILNLDIANFVTPDLEMRAPHLKTFANNTGEIWSSNIIIQKDQYRYFGENIYQALNTGETGSIAPTHKDGIETNGEVEFKHIGFRVNNPVSYRYNETAESGDFPRSITPLLGDRSDKIATTEYVLNLATNDVGGRVYVSEQIGSDLNDGRSAVNPVRTIKKAAQLAWSTPGVKETIIVSGGDYVEDNPISLPPDCSVVGDNLRLVIIRPANPGKHIIKFGDKNYVIGVTYRDRIDANGDPVSTWDFAMVFDDKQRLLLDYEVNGDFGVNFPIGHQVFGPDQFRVGFQQNAGGAQLQTGVEVVGLNTGARANVIGVEFKANTSEIEGTFDIQLTSGSVIEGESYRYITSAATGSSLALTITQTSGENTFRINTDPSGIIAGGSYIYLDDTDNSSFTQGYYEVAFITADDINSPTYWDILVVPILNSPSWNTTQIEGISISDATPVSFQVNTISLKSIRAEGEVVFTDEDVTAVLPIQRLDFSQQGTFTDAFQNEQFGNGEDAGGIVFYTNELVSRQNIHDFKEGQEIEISGLPTNNSPDISMLNGKQRIYKVIEDADGRSRRFVIPKKIAGLNSANFDPGQFAEVKTYTRSVTLSLLNSPNTFKLSTPVERRYQDACVFIRNNRDFIADEVVGRINKEFSKDYFSAYDISGSTFKIYLGTSRFAHTYISGGTVEFGGSTYNITSFAYDHITTGVAVVTTNNPVIGLGEDDIVKLADILLECENGQKVYPSFNIPSDDNQCREDIVHFLNALVRDLEFGSNHNVLEAAQKYIVGGKIAYIENEIIQNVRAIEYTKELAIYAMCNWRTRNRTTGDPLYIPQYSTLPRYFDNTVITATAGNPACDDVRSAIDTLSYLWVDVISNDASGTYLDAAYLIAKNRDLIADQALIDTENAYPLLGLSDIHQRKCRRDINFILGGLIRDLVLGGNSGIVTNAEEYFTGAALTGVDAEQLDETIYAYQRVAVYAIQAMRNWSDGDVLATTPSTASYTPTSGALTVTFPTPSTPPVANQDRIAFAEGAITFNCASGSDASPYRTDTNFGESFLITNVSTSGVITTISTNVGVAGSNTDSHTFDSALANGTKIIYNPQSTSSPIPKFEDWSILEDSANPSCANVESSISTSMSLLEDILDGTIVPGATTQNTGTLYNVSSIITYPDSYIYDQNNIRMAIRGDYDDYPIIEASPYTQNSSVISFLGGSGALVDGSKVKQPNCPFPGLQADGSASFPNQGKSMVAAAFTIVSFGGTGYKVINDGYTQLVSVFVIFCADGVLAESGGYCSITNSATNFGIYALRGIGFREEPYSFDIGTITNVSATPTGRAIITIDGLGREPLEHYVIKIDGYKNTNSNVEYFIDSVGTVGVGPPFTAEVTIDDGQGQPMDLSDISTGNPVSTSSLAGATINLHRPSIVNSSSHTWEFAGSGTNYLALPENGGTKVTANEQVSEDYGRVYCSGTDELGDFKVGTFAQIENRTGNITFTGTVTISEVEFLKLKGGDVVVTGFSADNTLGGSTTSNSVLPTQKAVRDYITNNLGPYIGRPYGTNAVPNQLVQLTDSGKISLDQIPALRPFEIYTVANDAERLTIEGALAGDIAIVEGDPNAVPPISPASYILNNDLDSLFLGFQPDPTIQFTLNDIFVGSVSDGRIQATEYRTGVIYRLNITDAGSGYTSAPVVTITGTQQQGGVQAKAECTIANGEVVTLSLIVFDGYLGGKGYTTQPTVIIDAPAGSGDQATANAFIESRLYGDIVNNIAIEDTDNIQSSDLPPVTVNLTRVVNTSSFDVNNWVSLSSDTVAANQITSGVIESDRLASGGSANSFTFLRGDSNFALAVQSVKGAEIRYFDRLSASETSGSSRLRFPTNGNVLIGHKVVNSVVGISANTNITAVETIGGITTVDLNNPITQNIAQGTIIEFERGSSPISFESTYTQAGFVDSIIILNGGLGFDNGQYFDVLLDGGSGTNLRANIKVTGNTINEIAVTDGGTGYTADFSITLPPAVIGGGSAMVLEAKISTVSRQYANVALDINRVTNLTISNNDYGTIGVSRFKKAQFNIGESGDGSVELKTGPNSGLDADLLDTKQGSFYLNATNINAGTLSGDRLAGTYPISISGAAARTIRIETGTTNPTSNPTPNNFVEGLVANTINNSSNGLFDGGTQNLVLTIRNKGEGLTAEGGVRQMAFTDNDNIWLRGSGTAVTAFGSWGKMWTSLNDGIGSGLDADRLQNKTAPWYQNALNINYGTLSDNRLPEFISPTKVRDNIIVQSFNGDPTYRVYLSGRILNVSPFTPGNQVNLYDIVGNGTGTIDIDNIIINDDASDNFNDFTIIIGRLITGNFVDAVSIGQVSNREFFDDFSLEDSNVVEVAKIESDGGTANVRLGRRDGTASSPGVYFNSSSIIANYNAAMVASGGTGVDGSGAINFQVGNADSLSVNGSKIWNSGNVEFNSTNVVSTAVIRDASGDFDAGTITASLIGSASLNVLKSGDTMTGSLTLTGATSNLIVSGTANLNSFVNISNDLAVDTDTLFVDVSTDRVGINAGTNPLAPLDVKGDGGIYVRTITNAPTTGARIRFSDLSTDQSQNATLRYNHSDGQSPNSQYGEGFTVEGTGTEAAGNLYFRVVGDVIASRNMGVNINRKPDYTLEVDGNARLSSELRISNTSSGAINFYNNSSTSYWRIGSNTSTTNFFTFEASDAVGSTNFTGSPALGITGTAGASNNTNAVTINTADTSGQDPDDNSITRHYALNVQGDFNINGQLFQDNSEFVTSRWTKSTNASGANIYRNSFVGIGNVPQPAYTLDVGGDLNVTGAFYVNSNQLWLDTNATIRVFGNIVAEDVTIPAGTAASSFGDISLGSNVDVVVSSGATWSIND